MSMWKEKAAINRFEKAVLSREAFFGGGLLCNYNRKSGREYKQVGQIWGRAGKEPREMAPTLLCFESISLYRR